MEGRVSKTRLNEYRISVGIWKGKRYRYKLVRWRGRRIPLHRKLAEIALGRSLPPGVIVHHLDGNWLNNQPNNLVICPDEEYHQLLHKRTKALNKVWPDLSDLGL